MSYRRALSAEFYGTAYLHRIIYRKVHINSVMQTNLSRTSQKQQLRAYTRNVKIYFIWKYLLHQNMKYNKLALSLHLLYISLSKKRTRPVPIKAFTITFGVPWKSFGDSVNANTGIYQFNFLALRKECNLTEHICGDFCEPSRWIKCKLVTQENTCTSLVLYCQYMSNKK